METAPVDLGSAGSFTIVSGPAVTTGASAVIFGDVLAGAALTQGAGADIRGRTEPAEGDSWGSVQEDFRTAYEDAVSSEASEGFVGGSVAGVACTPLPTKQSLDRECTDVGATFLSRPTQPLPSKAPPQARSSSR